MKRILIIGSSGAGKTTLANRLGETLGVEVIHLDKLHWKPNWTEPSKEEWQKITANALRGDSWIMDGNYGSTMEMRLAACNTVILLDLPHLLCVYRIIKRWLVYRKATRPDMAADCDEQFDWKFIKYVWDFPKKNIPKIEKLLQLFQDSKTIIRLKSTKEVENFFVNYSKKSC